MTVPRIFLEAIFVTLKNAEAVAVVRTVKRQGRIVSPCVPWRPGDAICVTATPVSVVALLTRPSLKWTVEDSSDG